MSGGAGAGDGWWSSRRRARIPRSATALWVAAAGAAIVLAAWVIWRAGLTGWDTALFRFLNEVPAWLDSILTPLSKLFLPAGLVVVIAAAAVFVVIWNRSAAPLIAGASAAALAWLLANLAKHLVERPRPYEVVSGAVLRQQPAHGDSFPSSHTAVATAVAVALFPFLPRPVAIVGLVYAAAVGWSRVFLGVHYPLDIIAGAGVGMVAGGLVLAAVSRVSAHPEGLSE
jgi:membrane-associated phospholipid phosphatase